MNKAELVGVVQKSLASSKASAERSVDAVVDAIGGSLKKGKPVQLVGFGTFKVVNRKARMGVNPKTKQPLKIKASRTVKFSVGKDLKSKLKQAFPLVTEKTRFASGQNGFSYFPETMPAWRGGGLAGAGMKNDCFKKLSFSMK